ncbi:hypothetical protein [Streptomyces sp. SID161]|uniref:hypothetical protein n=1 Tax=Streptomyces sp. SID161 TaxID=2690251 RepID=UPI00136FA5DA|nr:hypothetical protein [Streptomyces sp. SID161]MYW46370.1 hypothetical protein [Streptomyces sp. SID161]
MGAALHLAHVEQAATDPKRKRGGGGGGGRDFAEYANRIYQDQRADAKSRQLLLALAYVVTMQSEPASAKEFWRSVRTALGRDERYRFTDPLRELIEHDRPRYVAPNGRAGDYEPCIGPRLRPFKERPYKAEQMSLPARVAQQKRDAEDFRNTENICGAPGKHRVLEKQPGTGWYHWHWFCARHSDHARRVAEQVKAQNEAAPDPIPNAGGLMPCYFDADWVRLYRHYTWDSWEPPVYGVRADDWPVPGKEPVPQRARLRLIAGNGDLEDA